MSGDLENFNFDCVNAHNELRQSHGTPPLKYSKDLAKAAQRYAEIIASKDDMQHSKKEDRDNAGENLAMAMRPFLDYSYSGLGATVSWYSEIKDYDFNKEAQSANNEPTGHFTQVVWKESKEAGFGRAKNPSSNYWYIVGRYQPAGNFIGKYKENVLPLPRGAIWDKLPTVEKHLKELRMMEYTDERKHILDDWKAEYVSGTNATGYYCDITETFTTPSGSKYTGKKSFTEDPRKKPRPAFLPDFDESVYDDGDDFNNIENINPNSSNEIQKFIDSVVKHHNSHRANHGAGGLKLDEQLSNYAQDWAQELSLDNKMEFSNYLYQSSEIGENITTKNDKVTEQSAKSLVNSWYNENKSYNYQKEPVNFKDVGHFTQMIWKDSKKIGVGVSENPKGKSYIVCFYYPPGNVKNQFVQNVLKI